MQTLRTKNSPEPKITKRVRYHYSVYKCALRSKAYTHTFSYFPKQNAPCYNAEKVESVSRIYIMTSEDVIAKKREKHTPPQTCKRTDIHIVLQDKVHFEMRWLSESQWCIIVRDG